jgi:hypothetical protein
VGSGVEGLEQAEVEDEDLPSSGVAKRAACVGVETQAAKTACGELSQSNVVIQYQDCAAKLAGVFRGAEMAQRFADIVEQSLYRWRRTVNLRQFELGLQPGKRRSQPMQRSRQLRAG